MFLPQAGSDGQRVSPTFDARSFVGSVGPVGDISETHLRKESAP